MARRYRWLPVLLVLCGTTACIEKETQHTLYLSPDGSVQWTVLEQDIRSNEDTSVERAGEEREFLQAVNGATHAVGTALNMLGASDVRTQITRAERPYTVVTDARFQKVDALASRILTELQVTGSANLARAGDRMTFTLQFVVPKDEDSGPSGDAPVLALLEDLDHYRIVLTDGSFDSAEGFELRGHAAIPIARDLNEVRAQGGRLSLSLTWRVEENGTHGR